MKKRPNKSVDLDRLIKLAQVVMFVLLGLAALCELVLVVSAFIRVR